VFAEVFEFAGSEQEGLVDQVRFGFHHQVWVEVGGEDLQGVADDLGLRHIHHPGGQCVGKLVPAAVEGDGEAFGGQGGADPVAGGVGEPVAGGPGTRIRAHLPRGRQDPQPERGQSRFDPGEVDQRGLLLLAGEEHRAHRRHLVQRRPDHLHAGQDRMEGAARDRHTSHARTDHRQAGPRNRRVSPVSTGDLAIVTRS